MKVEGIDGEKNGITSLDSSVRVVDAHSTTSLSEATLRRTEADGIRTDEWYRQSSEKSHGPAHANSQPHNTIPSNENGGDVVEVFVEGGFWGWATVLGAMLLQFSGFGYVNGYGVYEDFYVREYLSGFSSSQISWIGSIQIFFTMTMGLLVGRLFDRGYFVHMAVVGSTLISLAVFMLSLAKPDQYYQVILSQGILLGCGSGLTYVPTLSIVSHHFRSPGLRAIAMGIVASGSSLGGLIHPIMLNNLFHGDHAIGFGRSVRSSAGLLLGLQLVGLCLVRTRYSVGRSIGKLWNLKGLGHVAHPGGAHIDFISLLKKLMSDWKYVFMVCGMLMYSMGLFFPIFYIQLNALVHGLDQTFSFYTIAILNGCSFIGRLLPGFVSHHLKLGIMEMIIFCEFVGAILIFAMLGAKTVGGVSAFATLYGLFSGAMITLLGPNLVLLADHPSEIGLRIGIAFAFTGVGALIGNPINGALLTGEYKWWRAVVFSGVMCFAGATSTIATRFIYKRERSNMEKKGSVPA